MRLIAEELRRHVRVELCPVCRVSGAEGSRGGKEGEESGGGEGQEESMPKDSTEFDYCQGNSTKDLPFELRRNKWNG